MTSDIEWGTTPATIDILKLQQLREWADDSSEDGGDVFIPGVDMAALLDAYDRMGDALTEIASESCTYLYHDDAGEECPGEACTAKRGLGQLPPRTAIESGLLS